jgi:hypothetical protein
LDLENQKKELKKRWNETLKKHIRALKRPKKHKEEKKNTPRRPPSASLKERLEIAME